MPLRLREGILAEGRLPAFLLNMEQVALPGGAAGPDKELREGSRNSVSKEFLHCD